MVTSASRPEKRWSDSRSTAHYEEEQALSQVTEVPRSALNTTGRTHDGGADVTESPTNRATVGQLDPEVAATANNGREANLDEWEPFDWGDTPFPGGAADNPAPQVPQEPGPEEEVPVPEEEVPVPEAKPGRQTGPRTQQGKERSRFNALKHGAHLEASPHIRHGLLAEDPEAVDQFIRSLVDVLAPRNALEEVQALDVAEAYVAGRRLGRYESLKLARDGRSELCMDGVDGELLATGVFNPAEQKDLATEIAALNALATLESTSRTRLRLDSRLSNALSKYQTIRTITDMHDKAQ